MAGDFTLDNLRENTVLHTFIVAYCHNRKYNGTMKFLKKFLYQGTGAVFKLLLLLVPIIFALITVLGTPDRIEGALKESRVYDQIVDVVIDNAKKENKGGDAQEVLSQPEIQAAAEKAFSPAVLQGATENFLDGIYGWVQGKTPEPQFTIDLTTPKNDLIAGVSDYAKKRASGLPVCTVQQLRLLNPDMDLLSIPCVPPGTNIQAEADKFATSFQDGADFLDKPIITNETLTKNGDGKSIGENLSAVPKAYKAIQAVKWILLVFTVLLGALLIFGRKNRRAGIRHVAWGMLGVATFLTIAQIVYWFVFDKANTSGTDHTATQVMVLDGAKALIREFNQALFWFIGAYVAIGAGLLIFLRTKFSPKPNGPALDPLIGDPELPHQTNHKHRLPDNTDN